MEERVDIGGARPLAGPLPARRGEGLGRAGRALLVGGLAVSMLLVGGIGLFVRTHRASPVPVRGTAALAVARQVGQAGSPQQRIASLQARLRSVPGDWASWASLGSAYVQQARITADPTYYPKAQGALQRSLGIERAQNYQAMVGMASLAAARHDFAGSLAWADRARAINPYNAFVYAVMGDAQIELGRYRDAFATFQRMIDIRPDLSTYARVSYGWELQGNLQNAVRAMELALQASADPSDGAWAANQLGELSWNSGSLDRAEAYYRRSAAQDPSFLPARVGLAKVAFARGHLAEATAGYRFVVERYPLPEYVIALGDLYSVAGDQKQAARQYGLVHAEEQLFRSSGVNVDLEIALFDADHGVDLATGLAAAQAEWTRRQSVQVADALAWELYANGRAAEALTYADQALRLGTRSALFLFHRAMIERELGRRGDARKDLADALAINPHFSILWAGRAARILGSIGGAP